MKVAAPVADDGSNGLQKPDDALDESVDVECFDDIIEAAVKSDNAFALSHLSRSIELRSCGIGIRNLLGVVRRSANSFQ